MQAIGSQLISHTSLGKRRRLRKSLTTPCKIATGSLSFLGTRSEAAAGVVSVVFCSETSSFSRGGGGG